MVDVRAELTARVPRVIVLLEKVALHDVEEAHVFRMKTFGHARSSSLRLVREALESWEHAEKTSQDGSGAAVELAAAAIVALAAIVAKGETEAKTDAPDVRAMRGVPEDEEQKDAEKRERDKKVASIVRDMCIGAAPPRRPEPREWVLARIWNQHHDTVEGRWRGIFLREHRGKAVIQIDAQGQEHRVSFDDVFPLPPGFEEM
jgi:hypothetical protein